MNATLKILKQYVKLRTSLEKERADIVNRLGEIDAALGTTPPASIVPQASTPEAPALGPKRGPGRPKKIPSLVVPVKRGPGRPKGTSNRLSAAGIARIIAGTKARWAKVKAEKGEIALVPKVEPQADKKPRRKVSAAGRARIAAAAKARWAKVKAEKAEKM